MMMQNLSLFSGNNALTLSTFAVQKVMHCPQLVRVRVYELKFYSNGVIHAVNAKGIESLCESLNVKKFCTSSTELIDYLKLHHLQIKQLSTGIYKVILTAKIVGGGNNNPGGETGRKSHKAKDQAQASIKIDLKKLNKQFEEAFNKQNYGTCQALILAGARPENFLSRACQQSATEELALSMIERRMGLSGRGGEWALECAIKNNLGKVAKALLESGVNPNTNVYYASPNNFCSLLHHTIKTQNLEMAILLLKYKANPNLEYVYDRDREVTLEKAVQYYSYLLSNLKKESDEVLIAKEHLYEELIDLLFQNGADPNIPDDVYETVFCEINSVLHIYLGRTVVSGYKIVESFINAGLKYEQGMLSRVLDNQWPDLCIKMLEMGANPNEFALDYTRIIHHALATNRADYMAFTEALIRKGADLNVPRRNSLSDQQEVFSSALNQALTNGWLDIVELMLENGADANFEDGKGLPFFQAVYFADKEIIALFRDKADFSKLDKNDHSVISYFIDYKGVLPDDLEDRLQLAIELGARIDQPSQDKLTPLSLFLRHHQLLKDWENTEVQQPLTMLLRLGADVNKVPLNIMKDLPFEIQDILLDHVFIEQEILEPFTNQILSTISKQLKAETQQLMSSSNSLQTYLRSLISQAREIKFFIKSKSSLGINLKNTFVAGVVKQLESLMEANLLLQINKEEMFRSYFIDSLLEWRAENIK